MGTQSCAKFSLGVLLVSFSLFPAGVPAQEAYRWVDEKGSVHFTDNFLSIPEKYRDQAEKRRLAPSSRPSPPPRSGQSQADSSAQRFTVPFARKGNAMIVQGTINGSEAVEFILDTGASGTLLPQSLASRLGIDPNRGVLIPVGTAGGVVNMPLVEINSLSVGGAVVRDLEVTLQDLPGTEGTGLLGMDFLSDFRMNINQQKNELTLEYEPGEYGGHSLKWWQQRFRRYRSLKKQAEQARSKQGSQPASELAERQWRAIEEKINNLEIRASQAGIPREFRQ